MLLGLAATACGLSPTLIAATTGCALGWTRLSRSHSRAVRLAVVFRRCRQPASGTLIRKAKPGVPAVGRCCHRPPERECSRCGCESCTLKQYLQRLHEDGQPEIVAVLGPYLDSLACSERPRSTLMWAEKRRGLLTQHGRTYP
jgi:hypothetical protein